MRIPFAASAALLLISTSGSLAQQNSSVQDILTQLTSSSVEIVQISETGDVIRPSDSDSWLSDAQTYPLINGQFLLLTEINTIDRGSCQNAFGCSTNRFEEELEVQAPTGWAFTRESISAAETGFGKNGHGIMPDPAFNTQTVPGTFISVVTQAKFRHWCFRDGGYADGGCESRLAISAMAIRYLP